MTHNIYTKWIIGGISLLISITAGCILWYQYTTSQFKKQYGEPNKILQIWKPEQQKEAHITTETTSPNAPVGSITQNAEKPLTKTTQDTKTTATEKPMPKMSPFGLGPYPEIPEDWNTPYLWNGCDTIQDELLTRVIIKMHNEGVYSKYGSVGIDHDTGLITPIEYGTVLVEYETNGKGEQVIWRVNGHPSEVPSDAITIWKRVTDIPSHLKVVTPEEVSIDPYEYLGSEFCIQNYLLNTTF